MKQKKEKESSETVTAAAPSNIPPVLENMFAPEVYADSAAFFALKSGNISIAFSSRRFDNSSDPPTIKNVIIGRLVMPAGGAKLLAEGLYNYMRQQGLLPDKAGAN